MGMVGYYNGERLSQRLQRCASGFFVQVHYISTVFFLRELLQGAQAQANTLHVTEVQPAARRVRRSAVFIAGGASLLASRYYETVDFHERRVIIGFFFFNRWLQRISRILAVLGYEGIKQATPFFFFTA